MAAFEDAVKTLVEMGFSEERSRAALKQADPPTADGALEYLVANEDSKADADGDEAMAGDGAAAKPAGEAEGGGEAVKVVRSYRCVETGKLFRTMQDAQLYAERTGRANFEESDVEIPPLTEEEKKAKVEQIRQKIKEKRAVREAEEKAEERRRELERRKGGQDMAEIRERHEKILRDAAYEERKKEKEAFKRERERLRKEVAKDKADRAADAARRRGETPEQIKAAFEAAYERSMGGSKGEEGGAPKRAALPPAAQIDESIKDLLAYRAGGDGERALKTLKKMLSNVVNNPDEPKYKQVNLENEAFKKRVASLRGGVAMLRACGFAKNVAAQKLQLADEDVDKPRIEEAIAKIDKALAAEAP